MKDTFKAAFDVFLATFSDGVKTIVNGDKTAQGFVRQITESEIDGLARNEKTGECVARHDDLGELSIAQAIKIDGKTCYVISQSIDELGVMNTFRFTQTRPITNGY